MKREDTPQQPRVARTVFRLTRDEVIEALKEYIENEGEDVPKGRLFILVGEEIVTLGVDHD